jgi:hypothetical protein
MIQIYVLATNLTSIGPYEIDANTKMLIEYTNRMI